MAALAMFCYKLCSPQLIEQFNQINNTIGSHCLFQYPSQLVCSFENCFDTYISEKNQNYSKVLCFNWCFEYCQLYLSGLCYHSHTSTLALCVRNMETCGLEWIFSMRTNLVKLIACNHWTVPLILTRSALNILRHSNNKDAHIRKIKRR